MKSTMRSGKGELFVRDKKTGRMTDAGIHEAILAGISPEDEAKILDATRRRVISSGMTLEQIAALFPKK